MTLVISPLASFGLANKIKDMNKIKQEERVAKAMATLHELIEELEQQMHGLALIRTKLKRATQYDTLELGETLDFSLVERSAKK